MLDGQDVHPLESVGNHKDESENDSDQSASRTHHGSRRACIANARRGVAGVAATVGVKTTDVTSSNTGGLDTGDGSNAQDESTDGNKNSGTHLVRLGGLIVVQARRNMTATKAQS